MKPLIGIVGWNVGENSFGAGKAYMEMFSRFGDVMILPPSTKTFDLDLLVLPGGKDVLSDAYGQIPSFFNSDPDVMKEYFFRNNLQHYVQNGTPIFGICLGMQMLNVFFGGELTQTCWHPYSEKSRSELVHKCDFAKEFLPIKRALEITKDFEVNSLHHQGVRVEELGKDLKMILAHDGIVEAFTHKELKITAVQWHPEEILDPVSDYLITSLFENDSETVEPATELTRA
jgi:putative glutamine amidotransferase